jgi:hypothetical protein
MPRTPHAISLTTFAAATLLFAAACGGKDAQNAEPRQIDLAPQKATEPQLADQPLPKTEPAAAPESKRPRRQPEPQKIEPEVQTRVEAPAPAVPAPIPVATPAPAPAPASGVVEAGTTFTVRPAMKICTNTHKVGDRFTATLANAVRGSNGVVIPEGAVAILRIVDAAGNTPSKDSTHLAFDILSIRYDDQTYEVVAHVTQSAPLERVSSQSTTDKAKKVGTGAVIGAIAGRILGGDTRSTVLGGAVGAAAGAAVAAGDTRYEGCLSGDGSITLALDRPLVLRLPQTP